MHDYTNRVVAAGLPTVQMVGELHKEVLCSFWMLDA